MATHRQVFVRKDVPKLWGLINRHWLVGFDVLLCLPTPTGRPLCGNGSTFVKAFLKTVNIWHLLWAGKGKRAEGWAVWARGLQRQSRNNDCSWSANVCAGVLCGNPLADWFFNRPCFQFLRRCCFWHSSWCLCLSWMLVQWVLAVAGVRVWSSIPLVLGAFLAWCLWQDHWQDHWPQEMPMLKFLGWVEFPSKWPKWLLLICLMAATGLWWQQTLCIFWQAEHKPKPSGSVCKVLGPTWESCPNLGPLPWRFCFEGQ